MFVPNITTIGKLEFLTFHAKKAFNQLRLAFLYDLVFQYFDLKCHIRTETDASGYAISGVLSQLTSDNLGEWNSIAYFSKKMIFGDT